MASAATERMTKEDWKKKNELDELRKSGAIEPEKDADGNEINPHIPQYMSQAPWYLNAKGPGLMHQRNLKILTVAQGQQARTVEILGKQKAVSRTRDEFGEKVSTKAKGTAFGDAPRANGYDASYSGKRDRWNGYDSQQYLRVMNKYEQKDLERKKIREAEVEASLQEGAKGKAKKQNDDDSDSSSDEDEVLDAEKAEMLDTDQALVGQTIDTGRVGMQTRVSVRNLRIREDTAKYLRNLDVRSAYYDPKTRSMRSNPNPDKNPHELDYAGENFIRYSGDTIQVANQQLYEFEAYERGQTVHMQAMPTQAERLHKQFEGKKENLVDKTKNDLFDQYGGKEFAEKSLPTSLALGSTEQYMEYSEDGTLIKGQDQKVLNSKYEEDKLTNNHTKVWGSFWYNGKWGYSCCCAFVRNSYCTAETGRQAFETQKGEPIGQSPLYENSSLMVQAMSKEAIKSDKKKEEGPKTVKMGDRLEGRGLETFDKKALKKALKEEDKKKHAEEDDDRKRGYNSMSTTDVTEEEMEAYMLKKSRGSDDPMAKTAGGVGGFDFV
mmetsp:Transcript_63760/g.93352  ORF Transcript_63760/g.93352 Transcript_63760/m.93352 type:complete len:550 (+) Transcript_63760:295-1944(+)